MIKVLQRFSMENTNLVGSTLLTSSKLSGRQYPKTKIEKTKKKGISTS